MNRSLGDITAENDHLMLDKAFFETPDYKTIIESSHKCVIVGRRGTGKSALNYKLEKYWSLTSKSFVFSVAPDEIQVIGLRDIFEIFGGNFSHVKAGAKLIWKYAVYLEIGVFLFEHYKFSKKFDTKGIFEHIIYWQKERGTFAAKARKRLRSFINKDESPQSAIADLIDILDIYQLEEKISSVINDIDIVVNILVDKVDEGYSPDTIGIALVDGFVQAVIDINNNFSEKIKSYIFIRDNIYRAIAKSDDDFTRNIESHILRLHWNEYNLFNLVCNRLRVANNISTENNRKLWNQFTAKDLQNNVGFRSCLRLTLYRPRDILVLLNNAFDKAGKEGRKRIIPDDIDSSSKEISENRLNDLYKEYNSIFPSIDIFSNNLSGGPANFKYTELESRISEILQKDDYQPEKQKDIALIDTPLSVIQRLYSVGFFGVKDMGRDNFIFCHDGRAPSKKLNKDDVFLIHPCYWLALNLTEKTLEMSDAEEIYDEYDIEVTSITEDQRNAKIEELLARIRTINEGTKGAYEFEKWCFDSVKILFAGSLM